MLPLFDNVPVRRFALVTYALIAANIAVFVWELGARGARVDRYAFYPCAVSGPCTGPAVHHVAWPEGVLGLPAVDARGQGGNAVEVALKIIRKQPYEKQVFIPFRLVTKENVSGFMN